jgi:hypothetical protein
MISPSAATLAISIAKGAIKLGGRIDRLMAEKAATTSGIVLPMPPVVADITVVDKAHDLTKYIDETQKEQPDPLGNDRSNIVKLLQDRKTVTNRDDAKIIAEKISHYFETYLPEKAIASAVAPDSEYLLKLKEFYPTLNLDDSETRLAAFYIRAGKDDRTIGYAGRVALLVVDVLAEFGAENTSLFVRDKNTQTVVKAVLTRFSQPLLEDYDEWSPLLRHAIGSTLNGVLDARESYQRDDRWIGAMLDALEAARKESDDDYLLGLFQGKGYRLLLSTTLSTAAEQIGNENANEFEKIAADVLKAAVPLVKSNDKNFSDFFNEHWGDLLNAGLISLEKHGPLLLEGESPLLRETLMAVINQLAETDGKELFTSATLISVVDSVIGAVAARPELITDGVDEKWLKTLIGSVLKTVSDAKISNAFTKGGLERIIRDAAAQFAEHPELLIANDEAFQLIVGGILEKVSGVDSFTAESIANAAVGGALESVAANPAFLDTKYAEVIAGFAGDLSGLVAAKNITNVQAKDIVKAATAAILENPILFTEHGDKLNAAIVNAVTDASAGRDERIVAALIHAPIITELFMAIAKSGGTLMVGGNVDQLKPKLQAVVEASLTRATACIGHGMSLSVLPNIIGLLVSAVANGELSIIDADDPKFIDLFNQFMQEVSTPAINSIHKPPRLGGMRI